MPERQTGWDGGVELYAGDRGSLSVTRYRQIARDLIYINFVAFFPVFEQQFVNVARVKNSGWELEGTLRLVAGLNARATYSETESIVQALGPFAGANADQATKHLDDALNDHEDTNHDDEPFERPDDGTVGAGRGVLIHPA